MNTDWPAQHGREWFEALLGDPDRVGLFAEVDGELAGGLMGSFPELTPFVRQREARLNSLWVLPATPRDRSGWPARRRVRGVGPRARCAVRRGDGVRSEHRGQRFYERRGFAPHTVTLRTPL